VTAHRSAHRSPVLLVLALGAVVGLAAGGGDPATAASGPDLPTLLDVAPVGTAVATVPVAPLVVPEPLAVRAPVQATIAPGVPVASWQLSDPAAGPVAGDVEGDPQAVAVAPSLEVAEALQRLRSEAADESAAGRRPGRAALVAMDAALDQVGDPYVWGATGPDRFDCSGLMWWSYARAGITLPRVSRDQYAAGGTPVDVDALLPGDLVFFATAAWDPGVVHHVGMYVGDGLMVAAPRSGLTVRVEPVPAAAYVGAVRPVPARGPAATDDLTRRHDDHRTGRASTAPAAGTAPGTATSAPTSATAPTAPNTESPTPAAGGTTTPEAQPSPSPTPTPATATAGPAPTVTLSPTTLATLSPVVTATLVGAPRLATPQLVAPVVVRP
jgi:cell wall-associated NlpC family hydrolase